MTKPGLKQKKPTIEEERRLHQRLARRLSKQMAETHEGQWVGLAHGNVIATAPTIREVTAALTLVEPNPRRRLVFKAGEDYRKRVMILATGRRGPWERNASQTQKAAVASE